MAKTNSAPKSTAAAKPAKAGKTAQAPAAKVGKLDKSAKSAPAKPAKSAPASGQSGQRAPRGQYADKRITVTAAGKEAALRGNRAARFELIAKAKNTNDVLGQPYTRADGEQGTITSSGLRNFVDRGLIELS